MASPSHSTPPGGVRDAKGPEATAAIALEAVAEAIARLRYGTIGLTIHDGRVVQLEITERQRFT